MTTFLNVHSNYKEIHSMDLSYAFYISLELKFYFGAGIQAGVRTFLHLKIQFYTSHTQLPDGNTKSTSQEGCVGTKQQTYILLFSVCWEGCQNR